jgi:hypothetical protein
MSWERQRISLEAAILLFIFLVLALVPSFKLR